MERSSHSSFPSQDSSSQPSEREYQSSREPRDTPLPPSEPPRAAPSRVAESNPDSLSWGKFDQMWGPGSNFSDLQKEEAWEKYKNTEVTWSGETVEVEKGIFGLNLNVKMRSSTFVSDVVVSLKPEEKSKALRFTKGDRVTFRGKLSSPGGSVLPANVKDAVIIE